MPHERMSAEPEDEGPFQVLLEALRQNDSEAWKELIGRYSAGLVALARARLDNRLRQKLDPEDVVMSIYRTFLRRHRLHQFDERLVSWDSLWGLLMYMTVLRCCKWHQFFSAQKRDLANECSLADVKQPDFAGRESPWEPADPNPTPVEAALLAESIQETLRGLDETKRQIILWGLLGFEDAEISTRAGRTEYRVRQIREEYTETLKDWVQRAQANPPERQ